MAKDSDTASNACESVAEHQTASHTDAIGQTVSMDLINSIKEGVKTANPPPIYYDHADVPFIYEIVEFDGWDQIVRPLAYAWIENAVNVQRVISNVKRSPAHTTSEDLLCGFCVFRLKERKFKKGGYWMPTPKDHGFQIHLEHAETAVFIALDDLGAENGFFMALKMGQDVVVDGRANILFPASGGGRGVCLVFKI